MSLEGWKFTLTHCCLHCSARFATASMVWQHMILRHLPKEK